VQAQAQEGQGIMKRLFASAALVALLTIGITVATAATASAAAPSSGALDRAWTTFCSRLPGGNPAIAHGSTDIYQCDQLIELGGTTTPQLNRLCDAMFGTFSASEEGSHWLQECDVSPV